MARIRKRDNKYWEIYKEMEPSYFAGGNIKWFSHFENSLALPKKVKQLSHDPEILLLVFAQRNENMST